MTFTYLTETISFSKNHIARCFLDRDFCAVICTAMTTEPAKKTPPIQCQIEIGLPNANKKESMGLCFVGRIRLTDFLNQKLKPKKGKIVDQDGRVRIHRAIGRGSR